MLGTSHLVAITTEAPGLVAALIAGLLSFLSPCVLPLVPSYIAFITGATTTGGDTQTPARWRAVTLGTSFVLGFSAVFIALGASASVVAETFALRSDVFAKIGGILVIGFGLIMLGWLRVPGSQRDARMMHRIVRGRTTSHLTSLLVGAGFAAGWSPCIGPVLASILTIAATTDSTAQGAMLLAAYSAGLAIPFLAASVAIDRTITVSQRMRPLLPHINRICGALLIAIGVLMVTGTMSRMSAWAARFTPTWLA